MIDIMKQGLGQARPNKKAVYCLAVCVVFLLCCAVYFRPLPLSGSLPENTILVVQTNEFGVQNGEPYIDSRSYDPIPEEQKEKILRLIREYSYRRTLKTVFSDGSIENIGNRAVSIYAYDHDVLVCSIYVSDSGQISINHRICRMKNAKQFLEQLKSILED